MKEIQFASISKLVVCILVIISATVLLCFEKIPDAAGAGMITGALGYIFGNGHGILSSKTGG